MIRNSGRYMFRWQEEKYPLNQTASCDRFFRFTHYDQLQIILEYVYWLDIYISVATVARKKAGFCGSTAQ